jgi:hypothetical protein
MDDEHSVVDPEAAILSKETAESLEKIFNVLMQLKLTGEEEHGWFFWINLFLIGIRG